MAPATWGSDLDIFLEAVACLLVYIKGMCNELHYNAFRNNAANIRHVKSCFMSARANALLKRETFLFLCHCKQKKFNPFNKNAVKIKDYKSKRQKANEMY